jgi:hypothetical protein
MAITSTAKQPTTTEYQQRFDAMDFSDLAADAHFLTRLFALFARKYSS